MSSSQLGGSVNMTNIIKSDFINFYKNTFSYIVIILFTILSITILNSYENKYFGNINNNSRFDYHMNNEFIMMLFEDYDDLNRELNQYNIEITKNIQDKNIDEYLTNQEKFDFTYLLNVYNSMSNGEKENYAQRVDLLYQMINDKGYQINTHEKMHGIHLETFDYLVSSQYVNMYGKTLDHTPIKAYQNTGSSSIFNYIRDILPVFLPLMILIVSLFVFGRDRNSKIYATLLQSVSRNSLFTSKIISISLIVLSLVIIQITSLSIYYGLTFGWQSEIPTLINKNMMIDSSKLHKMMFTYSIKTTTIKDTAAIGINVVEFFDPIYYSENLVFIKLSIFLLATIPLIILNIIFLTVLVMLLYTSWLKSNKLFLESTIIAGLILLFSFYSPLGTYSPYYYLNCVHLLCSFFSPPILQGYLVFIGWILLCFVILFKISSQIDFK